MPSDLIAAFLYAQLESIDRIQYRRKEIWDLYNSKLEILQINNKLKLPSIPNYATNNAHMFYVICNNQKDREDLTAYLKKHEIMAVFHYLSLHKSAYYSDKHDGRELQWSDCYSDCLLRLPFYFELENESIIRICDKIIEFYENR